MASILSRAIAFTRPSVVKMICLGFELADLRQHLDNAGVSDESRETRSRVRRRRSKWNWQLIAVKELGVATWIWLGVRDGIRNWLLTAA